MQQLCFLSLAKLWIKYNLHHVLMSNISRNVIENVHSLPQSKSSVHLSEFLKQFPVHTFNHNKNIPYVPNMHIAHNNIKVSF